MGRAPGCPGGFESTDGGAHVRHGHRQYGGGVLHRERLPERDRLLRDVRVRQDQRADAAHNPFSDFRLRIRPTACYAFAPCSRTPSVKDRKNRDYLQKESELLRPGPVPYVQKQLQQIQSFYNLRDEKGEYSSKFMMLGDESDIIVLPMARLSLKHLLALERADGKFQITQEALRYVHDPGTDVQPGETVEHLKERVSYPDRVEWEEEEEKKQY